MTATLFCALLLLPAVHGQSGYPQPGVPEDEEPNYDFNCISQVDINKNSLTCYLVDPDSKVSKVTFNVCSLNEPDTCFKLKKKDKYTFKSFQKLSLLDSFKVCLIQKSHCKEYMLRRIIKPDAPFNVTVTYQEKGQEYLITYNVTHSSLNYLQNKLEHQVAYRMENENWEYKNVDFLQIKLLERELKTDVKYEVKVRSKPIENYFNGTWSDWSASEYFKTKLQPKGNSEMTIALPVGGCILLGFMVILFITFWEKRIKSLVWAEIPDHKKTLEKLCRMPKTDLDISFDAKCFLDVQVHKIDAIQSKAELEHLLDVSYVQDINLPKKNSRGSGPTMSPQCEPEMSLKCPVTYGGTWPTHSQNGRCSKNNSTTLDALILTPVVQISQGNNDGAQLNHETLADHSFPNDSTVLSNKSRPSIVNSVPASQMQPNPMVKPLGPEEAYVTMSAFITTTKLQGT
ncbi:interleukin-7 receptor subunit alpha [Rhinatrema bivittatum]|uniref:interleukin-7 receptor subunit alpha n=1 Tax=Rhinatrema bivittatum TaxID=194408 RepID=UPI00112E122A|nr:interleukin-7 receptor subunit alpha [Rhinatrema bivittatum]